MQHLLRSNQYQRPVRLLLTACVSSVFLTGAGAPQQADARLDTRQRFIELDSEIQAIKEEILHINQDILLLEEMSLYPHGQQLVVLVSVANDSPVKPQSISLHLDGHLLSRHDYTDSESAALQQGGVHRLYTGRLSDGKHRLDVSVIGQQLRGQAFKQQQSINITKAPGRKYMEVHLISREARPESGPEHGLTVREW